MVARVLFPWLPSWWKTIASPPTGDHEGPPNLSSTTLAPTDRLASCLTCRLRLMRIVLDKSALYNSHLVVPISISYDRIGGENGSDTQPSPQLCTRWNVSGSA